MTVVYVVPDIYINDNLVDGHTITNEKEFIRIASNVGDVFPNPKVFQERFNDGQLDGSFILIK